MSIEGIDHFELVVSDVDRALEFYRALGVKVSQTTNAQGRTRWFLDVGDRQQVNLVTPQGVATLGRSAGAGGGHFCMVWRGATEEVVDQLSQHGLVPRRGPGSGWGALGEGTSLFINDPDSNSVEIIVYPS